MSCEPRRCPFCERPFVDLRLYHDHVEDCRRREQERLDQEWFKKAAKSAPEVKP